MRAFYAGDKHLVSPPYYMDMVIISRFKLKYKEEKSAYKVMSYDKKHCPCCKGELCVIGSKRRRIVFSDGIRSTLIIRKLRCISCHKIHSELPDILIPFHTICKDTIEKVIAGNLADAAVDANATNRLQKWWRAFAKFTGICYICQIKEKVNSGKILHTHFRHIKEAFFDMI